MQAPMPPAPGKHSLPGRQAAASHKPKRRVEDQHRGSARERGYTRQWEKFRATFLQEHPLCEYCSADGRVEPTVIVDHDLPHRGDPGLFWDNSFTGLCKAHHSEKARVENRLNGERLLDWVRRRKGVVAPAQ